MIDNAPSIEKATPEQEFSAPVESIENCVSIVETIYNAKGDSVVTADEIYAITGKPRGTMSPRVSACIQYSILENNSSGKGYRVSDFGVSVIRPEYTDAAFIKSKLLQAFNTPPLYKKLIERYNSKPLPNKEGLLNILVTEYGVNPNSTGPRAAAAFLDNCTYLGINEGGRLRFFMPTASSNGQKDNAGSGKGHQDGNGRENEEGAGKGKDETTIIIPLKKGEKRARLILPNGFDDKDLNRISKFVAALKENDEEEEK